MLKSDQRWWAATGTDGRRGVGEDSRVIKADGFHPVEGLEPDNHLHLHHLPMPQPLNLPDDDSKRHLVLRRNPVRTARGGSSTYINTRSMRRKLGNKNVNRDKANKKGSALVLWPMIVLFTNRNPLVPGVLERTPDLPRDQVRATTQ